VKLQSYCAWVWLVLAKLRHSYRTFGLVQGYRIRLADNSPLSPPPHLHTIKHKFKSNAEFSFRYAYLHLLPAKLDNTNTVVASFFALSIYSPLSLSCTTLNAVSKSSFSSFVCDAFKPVATLALGFRPAYITCLRS
jgi:hypothetical protein